MHHHGCRHGGQARPACWTDAEATLPYIAWVANPLREQCSTRWRYYSSTLIRPPPTSQSKAFWRVLLVYSGEASHTAPSSPRAAAQARLLLHTLQSSPEKPSLQEHTCRVAAAELPPELLGPAGVALPAAAAGPGPGWPVKRFASCCAQLSADMEVGRAAFEAAGGSAAPLPGPAVGLVEAASVPGALSAVLVLPAGGPVVVVVALVVAGARPS